MSEILTLDDVADYFRISKPTLKRWLMLSRKGLGDFPLPVSSKGCRLLWNREDITGWRSRFGNDTESVVQCGNAKREE